LNKILYLVAEIQIDRDRESLRKLGLQRTQTYAVARTFTLRRPRGWMWTVQPPGESRHNHIVDVYGGYTELICH